jgi:hypothetical protein
MANLNPVPGRLAKRAKRATGDIARLQTKLWQAILRAEVVMETGGDDYLALKAAHCLAQVAACFLKAVEVGELEARLEALETKQRVA